MKSFFIIVSLCMASCAGSERGHADAAGQPEGNQHADHRSEDDKPEGPLAGFCDDAIGPPRIEEVAPGLFVAIGYDLANTILLNTDDGNVVIDVGMSPERAATVKAALDQVAPGPVRHVIYTHSHIDHIGGASVWVEANTTIWATSSWLPNLVKQYDAYRPAETQRGNRQFGLETEIEALPCIGIGPRPDLVAVLQSGVRVPTQTFEGEASFILGGVEVMMVEAHGETDDQLYVWLPSLGALMPGDNIYRAFPNLYTIRGTSPRPITTWIASLDSMRALSPDHLIPSHTAPLSGRDEIAEVLTTYRDAIAWIRRSTIDSANALESIPSLRASVALPAHLASHPWLTQRYGQVDWSAAAMFTNDLGWFDGRTETLYPPRDSARRELELMGGAEQVLSTAEAARDQGDLKWAAHLLGKLRDGAPELDEPVRALRAEVYRALAAETSNTNGRGWLLRSAALLEGAQDDSATPPVLDSTFIATLPTEAVFQVLPSRLDRQNTLDVHESVEVILTDINETWTITIRRGVAEVRQDLSLPNTPPPVATVTTDSLTWKQLAFGQIEPLGALTSGQLIVDDLEAALRFLTRFTLGL